METLFWHDYETFGGDPRRDRPCQFAGIRTDHELNIVGEPVQWYCRPAPDFLPDPVSVAITGIAPQQALQQGLDEAEFCARIHAELAEPGTCGVGYNSLRFDDEVTRHLLYRNFHDAYEREWKQGNSRWDLIDVLRMTQALRPEGIVWPQHEDGSPSFRLEQLTRANGIEHGHAHEALADVRATLEMAKLVKQRQPKLFDYLFQLRNKHRVLPLLDLTKQEPVVHASRMFAASRGCIAIVLPLCRHPSNPNGIVVADLLADPALWMNLPAEELRRRVFLRSEERKDDEERIPLKTVHINRCPALAPTSVLTEQVLQRYRIDLALVQTRREQLRAKPGLTQVLQQVFTETQRDTTVDPDLMLYSGSFFGDHDKRLMQRIRESRPEQLAAFATQLRDPRLPDLLFRYRARNFPVTLNPDEKTRWLQHCRRRLLGEIPGAGVTLATFAVQLAVAKELGLTPTLKHALQDYARELMAACGIKDAVS
ncbi:MAG TPA: exodeoxyribonuclease I [Candidatus Acidoferrum sp.]|nr:exodeoxyribonuclease I [Candidatus Acidoferrum sp.]